MFQVSPSTDKSTVSLTEEETKRLSGYSKGVDLPLDDMFDLLEKIPKNQLGYWYLSTRLLNLRSQLERVTRMRLEGHDREAAPPWKPQAQSPIQFSRTLLMSIEVLYRASELLMNQLLWMNGQTTLYKSLGRGDAILIDKIPDFWEDWKQTLTPGQIRAKREELQLDLDQFYSQRERNKDLENKTGAIPTVPPKREYTPG
jgi:hypothetical protein